MTWRTFAGTACIVLAGLFSAGRAHQAEAATLTFEPTTGSYTVGQTIKAKIIVQSASQAINAEEGTINWDPAALRFVGIDIDDTINQYWITEPKLQGDSSVVFSGGLPSPGYIGGAGQIMVISFTAQEVGQTTVTIDNGSILANDGDGGNVAGQSGMAVYDIIAPAQTNPATPTATLRPVPVITSSSHADQSAWSRSPDVQLSWTKPNGLLGVSYSVTTDSLKVPDEVVETNGTSTSVTVSDDGVWYIHLRGSYASGWSDVGTYIVRVDRTAPAAFTPSVQQNRGPADPTPELIFITTDRGSGIADYTYQLDDHQPIKGLSPVGLLNIAAGVHQVTVTATDKAGNVTSGTTSFEVEGYSAPTITSISASLLLLDTLVVRGTAYLGDRITIFASNEQIGQTLAGPSGLTSPTDALVRVPWSFTSNHPFRPGTVTITATATSVDGLVSMTTDPQSVRVSGQVLMFRGRPVATLAVVTPMAVIILTLFFIIVAVMVRLLMLVRNMHRHELVAERDVELLRGMNRRQPITQTQLDAALGHIEEDLEPEKVRRRLAAARRPKNMRRPL